jgi:hypothetical protein
MLNYCNIRALCCAFLLSFVGLSHAQDIVTIESQVTGSKEQPKVITIVPWREPGEPDYYGDDVSELNQTEPRLQPINRASFIQEVKYLKALQNK